MDGLPRKHGWLEADNGVYGHLPKGSSAWAGYVKLDRRMPKLEPTINLTRY
jgi:hypothetical protein